MYRTENRRRLLHRLQNPQIFWLDNNIVLCIKLQCSQKPNTKLTISIQNNGSSIFTKIVFSNNHEDIEDKTIFLVSLTVIKKTTTRYKITSDDDDINIAMKQVDNTGHVINDQEVNMKKYNAKNIIIQT